MTEIRAVFDGFDPEGCALSRFTPAVTLTRGLFECCTCGAKQADYALPGSDGRVTCHVCEQCGGDRLYFLELFGRVDGGPEVNLVPIYERDVYPQVEALLRLRDAAADGTVAA